MADLRKFVYILPRLSTGEFSCIRRPDGARIQVSLEAAGTVLIRGDSQGLLYLAKHLAAMGLIKNKNGLHVHLNSETNGIDESSVEVTIVNIEFLPSRDENNGFRIWEIGMVSPDLDLEQWNIERIQNDRK